MSDNPGGQRQQMHGITAPTYLHPAPENNPSVSDAQLEQIRLTKASQEAAQAAILAYRPRPTDAA